jgi:hypothetical protein
MNTIVITALRWRSDVAELIEEKSREQKSWVEALTIKGYLEKIA